MCSWPESKAIDIRTGQDSHFFFLFFFKKKKRIEVSGIFKGQNEEIMIENR